MLTPKGRDKARAAFMRDVGALGAGALIPAEAAVDVIVRAAEAAQDQTEAVLLSSFATFLRQVGQPELLVMWEALWENVKARVAAEEDAGGVKSNVVPMPPRGQGRKSKPRRP